MTTTPRPVIALFLPASSAPSSRVAGPSSASRDMLAALRALRV
jgi:hypothetical protein